MELLTLHTLTRWLAPLSATHITAGRVFASLTNLQRLLSLLICVVGPTLQVLFKFGFVAALKGPALRFRVAPPAACA